MLGKTLNGRYKLTRPLGAGGFGQTYLAIDTQHSHQQPCVVKHLKPASQDKTFLTVARRLFDTESNTLKKLGSHSQIPNSIDFFEEDSEFYLVQEFIDGQSLEDEIEQAGKFTEAQAIALLEAVLPVLDFIHQNHVIHRDLKPDNLVRRRGSSEIVLIDFGAVKEIRTHLITGEKLGLTIGIGTQGYTPSEQLSGKPRYGSDIYALGMTVIQALTGRAPTDLPETPDSLEPIWQEDTDISPGLAVLLSKMTRHYIHQRYQSVKEVQRDLKRLAVLPAEAAASVTCIETTMPQMRVDPEAKTVIVRWRMSSRAKLLTVAISTLVTSACLLGMRQAGVFIPAELAFWDKMISAQKNKGPDPRLLIVEIKETDLDSPANFLPSDTALAEVIDNLQAQAPARIAIDLLRPQTEGAAAQALQTRLKAPNVAAVIKLSASDSANMIIPMPGIEIEQLSFDNLVLDPDFRVRRSLMLDFLDEVAIAELSSEKQARTLTGNAAGDVEGTGASVTNSNDSVGNDPVSENPTESPIEQPIFSLGTEVAIHYLKKYENIEPADGETLRLGNVRFAPISASFGGYQNADTHGYQMFIRYRSSDDIANRLSFSDIRNNRFNPTLVKDKIVFIGSTADNSQDTFLTPYNTSGNQKQMHGVEIHAQVASQILAAVIDGETLPWAWTDSLEVLWIVSLTGIGSTLMVLTQKGPILILFGVSGLVIAFGVGVASFYAGGWGPVAAPMSAFFLSAAGTRTSKSYQRRHWEARQADTEA